MRRRSGYQMVLRMERPPFAMCAHCGDRIGVYEPAVVVEGASARTTSLAREPGVTETAKRLLHAGCARRTGIDPAPAL